MAPPPLFWNTLPKVCILRYSVSCGPSREPPRSPDLHDSTLDSCGGKACGLNGNVSPVCMRHAAFQT